MNVKSKAHIPIFGLTTVHRSLKANFAHNMNIFYKNLLFFQFLMFLLTLVFILLTILFTQELQGVKTTLPYLFATSVYYLTTGKVSCFSD